jgi:hypothetical protein
LTFSLTQSVVKPCLGHTDRQIEGAMAALVSQRFHPGLRHGCE